MIPTLLIDLLNAIPRELILPPANLFLLIVVGLALRRRWRRAGSSVAAGAFVVLAFLSAPAGADFLVTPLETMTTPLQAPARAGAQAIVVLAAGRMRREPEYGDRDIPDYIGLARVRYGAHLQRATGLPILVSGGTGTNEVVADADARRRGASEAMADAMAAALREDFGVPVRWIEPRSRDTAENAAFSAALLRADGVQRILLVTDAMHMARARAAFQRAGMDVVDAPTMFFNGQARTLGAWLPSAEGMRRSWYALYELIGIAWYRVRAGGAGAPQSFSNR